MRAEGARQLYNLDLEAARDTFRKAVAADPADSAAYRGLASALWAQTASLRGSMTVDSYLGGLSRANVPLPPPPAALAAEFKSAVDQATSLARARLASHPDDVDAQYELGRRDRLARVLRRHGRRQRDVRVPRRARRLRRARTGPRS